MCLKYFIVVSFFAIVYAQICVSEDATIKHANTRATNVTDPRMSNIPNFSSLHCKSFRFKIEKLPWPDAEFHTIELKSEDRSKTLRELQALSDKLETLYSMYKEAQCYDPEAEMAFAASRDLLKHRIQSYVSSGKNKRSEQKNDNAEIDENPRDYQNWDCVHHNKCYGDDTAVGAVWIFTRSGTLWTSRTTEEAQKARPETFQPIKIPSPKNDPTKISIALSVDENPRGCWEDCCDHKCDDGSVWVFISKK